MVGARSTSAKLALLGMLYFAEGLPFGFQAKALPLLLRAHGTSLTAIGFAGALSAPWLAKALWAPCVDRYFWPRFGRRKSWIIPMQLALAATCVAAAMVSPDDSLGLLLLLVFLMNLFAATQDIAVDGLAVDLLGEDELGPGNAVQVVGYKLGMLTSGGLLVWASDWIGWPGLFLLMAALVGCSALFCSLYRESDSAMSAAADSSSWGEVFSTLRGAILVPGGAWLLLVVATYKIGETLNDAMFGMFLVDGPFTGAQVGLWLGTYGLVFSLAGSICGGLLARKVSFLGAVTITAVVRIIPLAAQCVLAAVDVPGAAAVIGVVCAEGFFGGALTTAMFALMMSRVDKRIGATHFTLLASFEVLGKMPTRLLSGSIADSVGYLATFAAGTVLSVGFLIVLIPLRRAAHAPR